METTLKNPSIICSAFVDAKNGKPNSRLKWLMKLRKKAKQKRRKKCT